MTENTTTTVTDNTSSRGAQWAGAGSLIAIAAQSLLGNGILGGLGGLGGTAQVAAQAANTAAAIELARKDAEIATLRADQATDVKLSDVFKTLRQLDKEQDQKIADVSTRVAALEVSGPLREENVRARIDAVATLASNGIATNSAAIAHLSDIVGKVTKVVIPNTSVCPGWGTVTVTPQGPFPFPPTPAAPATPA